VLAIAAKGRRNVDQIGSRQVPQRSVGRDRPKRDPASFRGQSQKLATTDNQRTSWWIGVGALLLGLWIYAMPLLLDIPLLDPDEGHHAAVAQEMVERGDYVTPRFIGQPFYDKPILFFWAQALSLRLFGMSEAAVRLPGLLFGLLGSITTLIVGWRLLGRRVGITAALFHATTALPVAINQAAVHDVAMIPWVNMALLAFWESANTDSRRRAILQNVVAGGWLGLAILTKGLIGVAVVGVVYGLYLIVRRSLNLQAILLGALSLGIAALVASPWYVIMCLRHPGYAYYYFVERHLLGYVTASQQHGYEPWWYYLPLLLAGGLPWVVYLPAALKQWRERGGLAETDESNRARTFVWLWLMGTLLFLSAAHSKMVTYLLPAFPAVSILAGEVWIRLIDGRLSSSVRRMMVFAFWTSCLAAPLGLPIALPVVAHKFHVEFSPAVWIIAISISLGSVLPLITWWYQKPRLTLAISMGLISAGFGVVMIAMMPHIGPTVSARDLADYINRTGTMPQQVLVFEQRIGSLIFYLDQPLRAQLHENQIRKFTYDDLKVMQSLPPATMLVVPEKHFKKAAELVVLAGVPFEQVGRFRVYGNADQRVKTVRSLQKSARF
jgi:4-amino-4-deoxy-L-arabinose transferase-like glycosyltransferase